MILIIIVLIVVIIGLLIALYRVSQHSINTQSSIPFYSLKLDEPILIDTTDMTISGQLSMWNGHATCRTDSTTLHLCVTIKYNPISDKFEIEYTLDRTATPIDAAKNTQYRLNTDGRSDLFPALVAQFIDPKRGGLDEYRKTARATYKRVACEKLEWKNTMESLMASGMTKGD